MFIGSWGAVFIGSWGAVFIGSWGAVFIGSWGAVFIGSWGAVFIKSLITEARKDSRITLAGERKVQVGTLKVPRVGVTFRGGSYPRQLGDPMNPYQRATVAIPGVLHKSKIPSSGALPRGRDMCRGCGRRQ